MTSFCYEQVGINPKVLGYQILVKGPQLSERRESGLYITKDLIREQQHRQNVGLVLAIGPSAFKGELVDRKCEIGDWISYSNFERSPLYVGDHVLYYISDAHVISQYPEEDIKKILERYK